MKVNDGNGLFDKYGLVQSCIDTLCGLRITIKDLADVGNPVIDVVNRLVALKNGLKEEDERTLKETENAADQDQQRNV